MKQGERGKGKKESRIKYLGRGRGDGKKGRKKKERKKGKRRK
jgi:hypothetical protein